VQPLEVREVVYYGLWMEGEDLSGKDHEGEDDESDTRPL
jgi:hypothetical protein